jgi:predicted enzyme related to lactoylglutathione lyase
MFQRPSAGGGAAVDWFEVLGSDAGRSQAFYAELFGWNVPGGAYGQVRAEGGPGMGGGIGAGGDERWATVYASVDDVEATLARAEALGGTRVYGPIQAGEHMRTGAFRDPAGSVLGVYHRES